MVPRPLSLKETALSVVGLSDAGLRCAMQEQVVRVPALHRAAASCLRCASRGCGLTVAGRLTMVAAGWGQQWGVTDVVAAGWGRCCHRHRKGGDVTGLLGEH